MAHEIPSEGEGDRTSFVRRLTTAFGLHPPPPPLGEVLIKEGVISEEQLREALDVQRMDPRRLGLLLVEMGYAAEEEILQIFASHYRVFASSLEEDISSLIRTRRRGIFGRLADLRIPIGARLSIAIALMIWISTFILSVFILTRQKNNLTHQTLLVGKISLNYLVNDAPVPMLEHDIVRLNSLLTKIGSTQGLTYAVIADREGKMVAHTDPEEIGSSLAPLGRAGQVRQSDEISYFSSRLPSAHPVLHLSRPIIYRDVKVGEARVGISLDFIDRQIWREGLNVLVLSFFLVLLGIGVAIKIGVSFSRPLSQLLLATREVGTGNLGYRVKEIGRDEFGDLGTAFNYMARELRKKLQMQKSFGSYVSPEILKMIMKRPGQSWLAGTRREVSVLFADVREFTSYAEKSTPEEVVGAMNEYFRIATDHIHREGGYVDKFIGDAVLGVFGAPVSRTDHSRRAVRAALSMQKEFREKRDTENPLLDKVGIGIHSGIALAGDIGSQAKKEYSVIGSTVNLASRIQSLAGPGMIIISHSTFEATRDIIKVTALSSVQLRGKEGKMDMYEVVGLREDREEG